MYGSGPYGEFAYGEGVADSGASNVTIALDQATETDVSNAFAFSRSVSLGQATETDTSRSLSINVVIALGQVTETDQVFALGSLYPVGRATETETALSLTPISQFQFIPLEQIVEADTARTVAVYTVGAIGDAAWVANAYAATGQPIL